MKKRNFFKTCAVLSMANPLVLMSNNAHAAFGLDDYLANVMDIIKNYHLPPLSAEYKKYVQDKTMSGCAQDLYDYIGICTGVFGYVHMMAPADKEKELSRRLLDLFSSHIELLKWTYKMIYKNKFINDLDVLMYSYSRMNATLSLLPIMREGIVKSNIARTDPKRLTVTTTTADLIKISSVLVGKLVNKNHQESFYEYLNLSKKYCRAQIKYFEANIKLTIGSRQDQMRYMLSEYARNSNGLFTTCAVLMKLVELINDKKKKIEPNAFGDRLKKELNDWGDRYAKEVQALIKGNEKSYAITMDKFEKMVSD